MAGLGLSEALDGYQQGVKWKQDQDEIARNTARRDVLDAANKAAADVIAQARGAAQQPAPSGEPATSEMDTGVSLSAAAPAPFKMTPDLLMKAFDVRGQKLAEAGDFQAFAENEAKAAPLRQQVRTSVIQTALQKYQADKDPVALARTVYDNGIFDGKTITNAEMVKGGGTGPTQLGAPSGSDVIRFTLSDGSVKTVDPAKIPDAAMAMLRDPKAQQELADFEFKERLRAAIEVGKQKQINADRHTSTMAEINRRGELKLDEVEARGEVQRDVAQTRAGATITAAQIRKSLGGGGSSGKGGLASVLKTITAPDGRVWIISRNPNEPPKLAVDDQGNALKHIDLEKLVGDRAKIVADTREGRRMNADNLFDAGRKSIPQPPTGAANPPLGTAKDYTKLWK